MRLVLTIIPGILSAHLDDDFNQLVEMKFEVVKIEGVIATLKSIEDEYISDRSKDS